MKITLEHIYWTLIIIFVVNVIGLAMILFKVSAIYARLHIGQN